MLRKITSVLLSFGLAMAVQAAEFGVQASAVNTAGEQRMLSQRIAKAYAQIGLGVMPELASVQLKEGIARFEENLATLKTAVPGVPRATDDHRQLSQLWGEFREAASRAPSRETVYDLASRSIAVLEAADRLTQSLEWASGDKRSELVNLSGRARMLSQRLGKAYILYSWGGGDAAAATEIEKVSKELSDRIELLGARVENTPEIRLEIEEIALQWEWLKTAMSAEGAVSYRLVVVEAADSILESTDRLTRLYERLATP